MISDSQQVFAMFLILIIYYNDRKHESVCDFILEFKQSSGPLSVKVFTNPGEIDGLLLFGLLQIRTLTYSGVQKRNFNVAKVRVRKQNFVVQNSRHVKNIN